MDFRKALSTKALPAAAALALFFTVSALYFAPQFRGEVLPQHDVLQYEGMVKEIRDNRAATGEDPQWAGSSFSGMPAYLISVAYPAQLVKRTAGRVTDVLDTPASFLFFAMTAMWVMLLILGVNPWVGIVPALAYGLSTYFLLIIGAGHITKMWALVYAPPMLGGAWMTLRGRMWRGAALTALAASLEIGANHPQITYYFLLAMAALWTSEGIAAGREKRLPDFARRTVLLAAAGAVALLSNLSPLWYTMQHSKDTIRGGSELAAETGGGNAREGLDLDYATAWSYGRAESFNLLIPDFMGRDSGTSFSPDGPVAAAFRGIGLRGPAQAAQQLPAYWGTQPYTGGPTYLGAAALFLAVLGLLLADGRNRWWIVAVSLLALFLSWGRNWMWFTELMFRILPGYDKFRTVSMALVVVQWTVPLLGALGLMRLWRDRDTIPRRRLLRATAWAAGTTGGLCLLLIAAGGTFFDFGRAESTEMMAEQFRHMLSAGGAQEYLDRGLDMEWGAAVADAMARERAEMMRADAWRSLAMILLAAGSVLLFILRKTGRGTLVGALAAIMLMDLVPVDRRFLSDRNFVMPRRQRIEATAADLAILQDKEPGFRVLNLTLDPFNDATTSYHHRSVGGYHGAKLARYQDLIEHYLRQGDESVLDMLNTRYVIVPSADGSPEARLRPTAFGPAWFVETLRPAASAHEEIGLLDETDLRRTAVVAARDAGYGTGLAADTAARIVLAEYRPNYLKYEYEAASEGVAVFSEIFYDKGWTATVDGREAPYFRADYVLRAMRLPAGRHTVEWRFRAPGWRGVESVTLIASLLVLAGAAAAFVCTVRPRKSDPKKA